MEKWNEYAERYVKDSNFIILAEFEYEIDCVFQFIVNHQNANNIISMTMYVDSIKLFRQKFDFSNELISLRVVSHCQIQLSEDLMGSLKKAK